MKPWKDLSMKERGAFMRVGVKNGITSVDDIRDAYNKFACGGHKFEDGGTKLSNGEFNSILRNQAEVNAKYWGVSPAEAYMHMLNDPTYDYRGFYEANPNAQNNPETHWPDTYKTYLHPTFSNESKYSGKIVFPYNPTGAVGGRWEGNEYIPNDEYHRRSWEEEKARMNQKAKGGRLAHKFDGTSEPTQRLYQNSQGNLLSQDQYDELVWRAKNNADIAAVNDYREVQVPVRQQQPINDRMFEGNLNEITVRPDIVYNSDVRNIPTLETTEEPISDEWRKRFARTNAQLRRQAQMTPAEQWANYYNNLFNLSYEDRLALENDRKFKRFIGGVAGGLITAPVTIPAIAGSIAYAPEAYSWLMQKGLPAATEFMSTKLNPGWWADQAALGARQLAQKYGLSALESGLSALTGEVGLSGMAGGFSAFGSSTIPGIALNAYLGTEMGYNAFNNLINRPFGSPDRTWKDNFWDALGLTGGVATGAELGLQSAPEMINTGIKSLEGINTAYNKAYRGVRKGWKAFNTDRRIQKVIRHTENWIKREADIQTAAYHKANIIGNQESKTRGKYRARRYNIQDELTKLKAFVHPDMKKFIKENKHLYDNGDITLEEWNNMVQAEADRLSKPLEAELSKLDKLIYKGNTVNDPEGRGRKMEQKSFGINLLKAKYSDLENFAKKHKGADISSFRRGPDDDIIYDPSRNPHSAKRAIVMFSTGQGEIQIFGNTDKAINLKEVPFNVDIQLTSDGTPKIVFMHEASKASDILREMQNVYSDDALSRLEAIVSEGYRDIIAHNMEYVEKVFGGKGIGSASVRDIPHVSDDYDIIVPESVIKGKISDYKSRLDDRGHFEYDLGEADGMGKGYYKTKPIDVNVILEGKDGKAEGFIAEEIFRQFFPKEATKAYRAAQVDGGVFKINKTPEELYKAFDSDVKTILDCLENGKLKHDKRIFGYIRYADKSKVRKAIRLFGEGMAGQTYKKAPNFDFTDVAKNKELLNKMDVGYDFSDSPEDMQNLFDYYCLSNTMVYRGLSGTYKDLNTLNHTYEVWPDYGGSAMGVGTNNVVGGGSGAGDKIRMFQVPVNREGVTTPDEYIDRINWAMGRNLKFTAEQAAAIDFPATAEHPAIVEGTTSSDILHMMIPGTHEKISTKTWNELSKKLQKVGIYAVSEGKVYNGSGEYASVTDDLPKFLQSMGIEFEPQYLPVINMHSIKVRSDNPYITIDPTLHNLSIYDDENITFRTKEIKEYEKTRPFQEMYGKYMDAFHKADENRMGLVSRKGRLGEMYVKNKNIEKKIEKKIEKIGLGLLGAGTAAYLTDKLLETNKNRSEEYRQKLERDTSRLKEHVDYLNEEVNYHLQCLESLRRRQAGGENISTETIEHKQESYYNFIQQLIESRQELERLQHHLDVYNTRRGNNKKSYGGPLELNDQYGIGKYINY